MNQFKCRSSALGKIMIAPRAKSESLSETAKTYLKQWWIEQKFGRTKDIESKYISKGNEAEEQSITLLNEYLLKNKVEIFLKKNPQKYENEYITGTPDLVLKDQVIDIKTSWDLFTFPFFDTECPNKDYYYQLQGYMALTGRMSSILCYVLTNTPEALIFDECRRESYKLGLGGEITPEIEDVIRKNHTFDDIPLENRIRIFQIPRDTEVIESMAGKVEECRTFLQSF